MTSADRRLTSVRATPWPLVVGVLTVSRALYYLAGVRFDVTFSRAAMQLLDRSILSAHPLQSTYYLHIQPPLFNLFVGLGSRAFGSHAGIGFQIAYLGLTVALGVNLHGLLRGVGAGPRTAAVLTTLVLVSPTLVQYENLLFYAHLELVGLVVAARLLQRWLDAPQTRTLVGFSACLTALTLSRSLYHPVWIAGIGLVLLLVATRAARRALALAFLVPLVAGLGLMAKNQVVFGWFTNGSLSGLNLHRITQPFLTPAEQRDLVRRGVITQVSTDNFTCVTSPTRFPGAGPDVHVPGLDDVHRTLDPNLFNYNHRSALPCLRRAQSESLAIIREHPDAWWRGITHALPIWGYAATPDDRVRPGNQRALRTPGRVEAFLLGSVGSTPNPYSRSFGTWLPAHEEWVVVVGAPVSLVLLAWSVVRRRGRRGARTGATLPAFLACVLLSSTVLTQLTEVGENNRFRFTTDPLLLVAVVLLVATWRGADREPVPAAPVS